MTEKSDTGNYLILAGAIIAGWWIFTIYGPKAIAGAVADQADQWWRSLWGGQAPTGDPADAPISYDPQGCPIGTATWCESLNHCVPIGLTCPDLHSDPIVVPDRSCPTGFYWDNSFGFCVRIPGTEPIEPGPVNDVPIYSDVCTWPDGSRLTVPAGMDCDQAVADMCRRFSSIPGYKGCSS